LTPNDPYRGRTAPLTVNLSLKMEQIEGSEKSAFRTQTPGNYPKENILQIETGLLP